MIRTLQGGDLPEVKKVIDACGLFPSDLLDDMVAGYFSGADREAMWLTYDAPSPMAVAYATPERMTEGTWNLLLVAVHPDHQGKGIGSALVQHVESILSDRGHRLLLVETSGLPAFDATRKFYAKCGFEAEGRIRDFYKAGEDKLVYRKVL